MARVRAASISALLSGLLVLAGSCTSTPRGTDRVDLLSTGLAGWQQIGGEPGSWRYAKGVLWTAGEGGGWLSTVCQYDDFRLSLEFKIAEGGDSGVFVRAPHGGDPAYAGMKIQIVDDYAEQHEGLAPGQFTGSIYEVQAPSERASKPAGQWQKMVIVCQGSLVKVVLNGRQIVDTNLTYFPYKYAAHPGLTRAAGYVGLQSHGSRVEFRDIRIEPL